MKLGLVKKKLGLVPAVLWSATHNTADPRLCHQEPPDLRLGLIGMGSCVTHAAAHVYANLRDS